MSVILPPLNALRCFEVAARHLSFTRAAEELHVTPAAVSHQIKGLEEFLDTALFRRLNRGLTLTEAGETLLPGVRDGFDAFLRAIEKLRESERPNVLTTSVSPSFAIKWLVPRLDQFREAYPEVDVRLSTTLATVDYVREGIDIGVRLGSGRYPGLRSELMMRVEIAPLCSPRLLAADPPLREPADLRHFLLLHDDTLTHDPTAPDWRMWLRLVGIEAVDPARGLHFDRTANALDAAVQGLGVALTKINLAEADIAAGRLVQPFAERIPTEFGYYAVYPEAALARAEVRAFHDWLMAESVGHRPSTL